MNEREGPLVKAFVELADTLVADYDVIELAQRLVDDCVRLLAVDAAGILLAAPGDGLQVLASTTEQARLLELFQVQSEAGPCLLAYRTGVGVLVDDLIRWIAGDWGKSYIGENDVIAEAARVTLILSTFVRGKPTEQTRKPA